MKIYMDRTVMDAAVDRINWLYDNFEQVVVGVSGGKDSTVLYHLTMQVARERDQLPLKVFWIDQEAEWQATADIIETWMRHPDVDPYWFQMPMHLTNSTSFQQDFLHCWDPEKKDIWMRDKVDISIKENNYGTTRFHKLFEAITREEWSDKKTVILGGMRCEENPRRFIAMTATNTYRGRTWGKNYNINDCYAFYPLYDWSYSDIWKAIHDNDWEYNDVYDQQYRYGLNIQDMRISNLHHETAVESLFRVQEIEPETWNKLTKRIDGIHGTGQLGKSGFWRPDTVPQMFDGWKDYRDYLLEKLVQDEENRETLQGMFRKQDLEFEHLDAYENILKKHVQALIVEDVDGTKLKNLHNNYSDKETREVRRQKEQGEYND